MGPETSPSFAVATDGDGDRVGVVLPGGVFFNPHQVLTTLALYRFRKGFRGRAVKNFAVTWLLDRLGARLGFGVTTTPVGFKWIKEEFLKGDCFIGGEESGGVGYPEHLPERDGILTSLLLLESVAATGKDLSEQFREVEALAGLTHAYERLDLPLKAPLDLTPLEEPRPLAGLTPRGVGHPGRGEVALRGGLGPLPGLGHGARGAGLRGGHEPGARAGAFGGGAEALGGERMRRYAVILAGGKGERFWPLSTPERPKPFLRLFGSKSLLEATGDRLRPLFGEEGVYVVVPPNLVPLVREHLPWLREGHVLEEPEPKDTAFAVAFALRALPEGTLAFFPADHYVGDEEAFRRDLALALEGAESLEGIVTLGVPPTYPATGYGYLERGEEVGERLFRVRRFLEKPSQERAEELFRSGRHYWNAGIFVAKKQVWLREFREHAPGVLEGRGEKVSLDYALMEKTQRAFMVPASFPWDDLGDWRALERHLKGDGENLVLARHVGLDTRGSIVYAQGDEVIVTIGLEDLLIVREGKVTLIARKERVEDLKRVLRALKETRELPEE